MRSAIRELIQTVALALLIFFLLRVSVQNYQVQGPSMEPNLINLERVLVNKLVYMTIEPNVFNRIFLGDGADRKEPHYLFRTPERGDVVVFLPPFSSQHAPYVKRIIGKPGDTVQIRNGVVYVNGGALEEPYVSERVHEQQGPVTVAPGFYYVLGDNRRESNDSRNPNLGVVPAASIIGKVWLEYWPPTEIGVVAAPYE